MAFSLYSKLPSSVRYWIEIIGAAISIWMSGSAFVYAAALAFSTIFSIAPIIIVAVVISQIFLDSQTVQEQIMEHLVDIFGEQAAQAVGFAVENWYFDQSGLLPSLISLVVVLVGATTVFMYLQLSLNAMWSVIPKPSVSGWMTTIKSRLLALAAVMFIGIILLSSLLFNVVMQVLLAYAPDWVPLADPAAMAIELAFTFVVIAASFAVMFRVLPLVVLRWRDVIVGACVTAVLFLIGRQLISIYLARAAPASAYGAAASVVVLLLWVNYSALILLYGAAFTRAHLEARGRPVKPRKNAVFVQRGLPENNA